MDPEQLQQRLSQISTVWTLLAQAQGGPQQALGQAQAALLQRYQTAIYRYLLGGVGNPDHADELFQEFALRFVRGDFRHVAEEHGRFRDYLRKTLSNQIGQFRKKQGARAASPQLDWAEEVAAPPQECDLDEEFLTAWRQALLERAWQTLAEHQRRSGAPYHDVLRLRYECPDLSSSQLTEALSERLRPAQPFNDNGVRKWLQRARDLFGDLLLDEIARSLHTSSLEELEQELIDLGFQPYCKRALERRRPTGGKG